jgi:hypothetical protein
LLPSDGLADTKRTKFGIHSPVDSPTLRESADHLSKKAYWFSDGQVETNVVVIGEGDLTTTTTKALTEDATIMIAMGLSSSADLKYARSIFEQRLLPSDNRNSKCQFALDCSSSSSSEELPTFVGPYDSQSFLPTLLFPWTSASSGRRFQEQMSGLFDRWTSDDFTIALMLFLNRFSGHPINWVKDSADATWEKGPLRNVQEFYGMGKYDYDEMETAVLLLGYTCVLCVARFS